MSYVYKTVETIESENEIINSHLRVHFERYSVEISIRRPLSLLWSYVVKKVLALHLRREEEYRHYNVITRECGVLKILDEIGLSLPRIVSKEVWILRKYSIYDIADADLAHIFGYIPSAKILGALAGTCRRALRLITDDDIYAPIFSSLPLLWQGRGNSGTERHVWEKYRETMSLEYYTICRLQWNSHHTSRLRLLYGERPPAEDVFSGCTGLLGDAPDINKIVILGASEDSSAELLLRVLACIIPTSAKDYYTYLNIPLLTGKHVTVENISMHINTSLGSLSGIISHELDDDGKYTHKIGDTRLTFAMQQLNTTVPLSDIDFEQTTWLFHKMEALIIAFTFSEWNISTSLNTLQYLLNARYGKRLLAPIIKFEGENYFDINDEVVATTMHTPLLIMMNLEFANVNNGNLSQQDRKQRIDYHTRGVLNFVAQVLPIAQMAHVYVQPYSLNGSLNLRTFDSSMMNVTQGFYAGINWLQRIISRSY